MQSLRPFLNATAMIFDGKLRLLPAKPDDISPTMPVSSVQRLLDEADAHIRAGRIAILGPDAKQKIIQRAKEHEIHTYDHLLDQQPASPSQNKKEGTLF